MTKEQFYKNCLTKTGREENNQELNNLSNLKGYYIKDIDINDISKWDEIIYMPKYGNIDIQTGEIREQQYWDIWTFSDIIINTAKLLKTNNKSQDINKIILSAEKTYKNLDGLYIFKPIEITENGEENIDKNKILQKLNSLPKLHQEIIKYRFGIDTTRRTAEEIATLYNMSINEIHNITNQILRLLREK